MSIEIKGIEELAKDFPTDDWYEVRILVRKTADPNTAEVRLVQEVRRVSTEIPLDRLVKPEGGLLS